MLYCKKCDKPLKLIGKKIKFCANKKVMHCIEFTYQCKKCEYKIESTIFP